MLLHGNHCIPRQRQHDDNMPYHRTTAILIYKNRRFNFIKRSDRTELKKVVRYIYEGNSRIDIVYSCMQRDYIRELSFI